MTEPETTQHVKVSFEPRRPRRHRLFDVLAIVFAAALIGTVFNSGVVFAIVAAAAVVAYVVSPVSKRTET